MFDHLAMMKDSSRWPCWPFLPLKRGNNELKDKNLGVLVSGYGPKVFHQYLFDLPSTIEKLESSPNTEYSSFEELLADGWVVD